MVLYNFQAGCHGFESRIPLHFERDLASTLFAPGGLLFCQNPTCLLWFFVTFRSPEYHADDMFFWQRR